MSVEVAREVVLEPTVFEEGRAGKRGYALPPLDVPEIDLEEALGASFLRAAPPSIPELSEPEVVRHFTRLA